MGFIHDPRGWRKPPRVHTSAPLVRGVTFIFVHDFGGDGPAAFDPRELDEAFKRACACAIHQVDETDSDERQLFQEAWIQGDALWVPVLFVETTIAMRDEWASLALKNHIRLALFRREAPQIQYGSRRWES